MVDFITLLFLLLFGHALADFALQPEIMAKLKNRYNKPDFIPKGQKFIPTWEYWLFAHGLIHGGFVYIFTGIIWLGIAEVSLHIFIDFLKCENYTNPHIDQFLHIISKVIYILVVI